MTKNKTQFIAEIGSNHNGSINRIFTLIEESKEMGFDAVKLQLFKGNKLWKDPEKAKAVKKSELPIGWIPRISKYCKQKKIKFGITPFHPSGINSIKPYVDFIKISSFDIDRNDFILSAVKTKLPVYISCGLASLSDIANLMDSFPPAAKIAFFHCVSMYPTPIKLAALSRISDILSMTMQKMNISTGYSDHTKNPYAIIKAIELGAEIIELHYDLQDEKGNESSYGHCWTKTNFGILTRMLSELDAAVSMEFSLSKKDLKMKTNPVSGLREW